MTQRLQVSWTRWRRKRTLKKLTRANQKVQLMRVQMEDQLLRLNRLDKLAEILSLELEEQEMSREYHLGMQELPPGPTPQELEHDLLA